MVSNSLRYLNLRYFLIFCENTVPFNIYGEYSQFHSYVFGEGHSFILRYTVNSRSSNLFKINIISCILQKGKCFVLRFSWIHSLIPRLWRRHWNKSEYSDEIIFSSAYKGILLETTVLVYLWVTVSLTGKENFLIHSIFDHPGPILVFILLQSYSTFSAMKLMVNQDSLW